MKKIWAIILVAAVIVLILAAVIAGPLAQWMWFSEDAGYARVFTLQYTARAELFSIVVLPTIAILWLSFAGIRKQQAVYAIDVEPRAHQLSQLVAFLQERGTSISLWASCIIGFFAAEGFAGNFQDMLVATHGVPFGMRDPVFGLDLSWFAFELPWLQDVLNYCLSMVMFVAVIAIAVHFSKRALTQLLGVRFAGKGRDFIFLYVGLFFVLLAFQAGLGSLSSLSASGDLFVGPDMAGMVQVRMLVGLAIVLGLGGIYLLLQSGKQFNPKALMYAAGPAVAWYLIAVQFVPFMVLKLRVDPDKINAELPYAKRALEFTKFAYGLSNVSIQNTTVEDVPSAQEVKNASSTFDNMRLWDTNVLQSALEATQSLRPYYLFNDVDVDRYLLPGNGNEMSEKLVMLSPRDIYLPGLSQEAQTWVNTRLGYTHGYGVVMAEVNKSTRMGQPSLIAQDIPQSTIPQLPISQPRLYFSDFRHADGSPSDEYAIVDTKSPEIDYPTQQGQATYRWLGDRGILLNSFGRRLLFSFVLGDWNMLISTNMKPTSRLLWKRNVMLRAKAVYPFLSFDQDPYIVLDNGHVDWILDGYTTSDQIPYSQFQNFHDRPINYIRNSVKIVIDAYSGQMTAYQVDGNDPVLKTYENIYPGLVRPFSQIPANLIAHLRYPEDVFNIQSSVLTLYHVANATTFLENSDAWDIANERGLNGDKSQMPAYYVLMRLPDEPRDEFLLILPFTPLNRDNMTGWLAAHCDPAHYGQLTLYKFPKGDLIPGPAQEENFFVQDKTIADINRNMNNDQSQIIVGNLLVIPVGHSLVYSETLFLQSRTTGIQSIPELKKVILATQRRIVVADTYEEALNELFGQNATQESSTVPTNVNSNPRPSSGSTNAVKQSNDEAIRLASQYLDQAQAALKSGDLAGYAKDVKEAGEILKKSMGQLQNTGQTSSKN